MIVLENRSDIFVGAVGISPPLAMDTYERWCIDSPLFRQTSTPFRNLGGHVSSEKEEI